MIPLADDTQSQVPPRPVDAAGNPIYRVPEVNMEALAARITKMNKRAAKLKMEPLVLSILGREFEPRNVRHESESRTKCITIQVALVTLTGVLPRVNGWSMAATVQHDAAGNLLRTVPGFETSLPLKYRTAATDCDHCQTHRQRHDTYILYSEVDVWKQVGRNCLADFLRSGDAAGLAEWAEFLASLDQELSAFEEGFSGGRAAECYTPLRLLAQVACCVRADGWCSRSEVRNSFAPKLATVDAALSCWNSVVWNKLSAADQKKLTPTQEDEERAAATLEWAQTLPTDVTNDYLWNIRTVSYREMIGHREAGLAGSIIAAYNRHLERELQRKYDKDHPSQWFGELKAREIMTLTVIGTRETQTNFGLSTLVLFRTPEGNRAKWFCTGHTELNVDETYTVKATVKEHETYQGSNQTVLTRVVVYDEAAELQLKESRKATRKALGDRYTCKHKTKDMSFEVPLEEITAVPRGYVRCCRECRAAWSQRRAQEEAAETAEVAA